MSRREAQLAHAEIPANQPSPLQNLKWSRVARLTLFFAWCVTFALTVVAVLHLLYHDGNNLLTCFNAFTRYIYLPAYACLAVALTKRCWMLAAINLMLVTCHLIWIAPDFSRDRRFELETSVIAADTDPSTRVRIFFANVQGTNNQCDAMIQEIDEVNPDIVVLVEFAYPWGEVFRRSPIYQKYQYTNAYLPWVFERVVVYSRLPLQNLTEAQIAGRLVLSIDVPVGSQTLHLMGLHSPRPTNFRDNDYADYWKSVLPSIERASHPLVVVGDFNATPYSAVYQRFKEDGLRSAHEDRGRGYATTWPNGEFPVPPIRIDQAFISPDVACIDIAEGVGRGSDHKPLILDVQVSSRAAM